MRSTALFVTCLVDQLFPGVGEAAIRLLDQAGRPAEFPEAQTCCGQPALNSGFPKQARQLARRFIEIFEPYEAVVTPSGSCASMARAFFPDLFSGDALWRERAESLGRRVYELSEYLTRCDFVPQSRFRGRVAYHPSCHALRELGIDDAPLRLLRQVESLELVELRDADRCCGFGGSFSVKFPELSVAMLDDKLAALESAGVAVVTSTDVGCLMHMAGALSRKGSPLRTLHLAEVLVGSS